MYMIGQFFIAIYPWFINQLGPVWNICSLLYLDSPFKGRYVDYS